MKENVDIQVHIQTDGQLDVQRRTSGWMDGQAERWAGRQTDI